MNGIVQDAIQKQRQIWTGDTDLDFILDWKISEAKEKGISVRIKAQPCACRIDVKDLCTIIGNLMDNAIEACIRIEKEENRWILVSVHVQGEFFIFNIANPLQEIPRIEKGYFLSWKRDFKERGFGIESVRSIVEKKYGGSMRVEFKKSYFEVLLVMRGT